MTMNAHASAMPGAPGPVRRAEVDQGTAARIDLETVGKVAQVADGVWLLATRHHPGMSKHMFQINNRCFVFRLQDTTGPVLLVVNAVDPAVGIPEVRRLEHETGLTVRYIVSPGGGHHIMMLPWYEQFPNAQVLLGPVRIPRTRNGQKLMKLPRVRTLDLRDPLPQFKGQLDAVLFTGLLGAHDEPTPPEGASDSKLAMIARMAKFMTVKMKDPVDELWLHHPPTGMVIAGENLAWQYPAAQLRDQPFMLRSMVKPDRVWIWPMARKVGDAATVAACWRQILTWPCRTLMTYHDPATHAFVGDGRAALEAAAREAKQI
jgi:hypothetical protein